MSRNRTSPVVEALPAVPGDSRAASMRKRHRGPVGRPLSAEVFKTGAGHVPAKILLAVTHPYCASFFRGQLAALSAAGAEVTLVTSPGDWPRTLAAEEGAQYRPIAMRRQIAPLADLKALFSLVRLLRRVRPDVVNAGTPKAALLVLAAAAAVGVPGRVYSLLGLRSSTLTGAKRVVARTAERLSARLATDVISISASLRDEAAAAGIVDVDRTHVFGAGSVNGVDLEKFAAGQARSEAAKRFRRSLGCAPDDTLVGFVARLTREKGLLELAEAWQLVRNDHTRLVLIGPDETEPECESALRLLKSDPRVRFTGTIADMPTAFAAIDLVVLPSWREGLPSVLIEAGAAARPVVATRVTGCVDAVVDGETGILVPAHDPPALTAAIRKYLDNPDMRAEHGAAGRRRVELLFDSRRIWREQIALYNTILRRSGRPPLVQAICPPPVQGREGA